MKSYFCIAMLFCIAMIDIFQSLKIGNFLIFVYLKILITRWADEEEVLLTWGQKSKVLLEKMTEGFSTWLLLR